MPDLVVGGSGSYVGEATVGGPARFKLVLSANIAAGGANTTVQLTAPATKTTADFSAGRIQDDDRATALVDVPTNDYREDEWCIVATADAVVGRVYEFLVCLADGTPLDTYTVTPEWTVSAPAGVTEIAPPVSAQVI